MSSYPSSVTKFKRALFHQPSKPSVTGMSHSPLTCIHADNNNVYSEAASDLPGSAQLLHHNQLQEWLFNPSHQDPDENADLFSRLFPQEDKLPFCLLLFDFAEQVVTEQPRTKTKM